MTNYIIEDILPQFQSFTVDNILEMESWTGFTYKNIKFYIVEKKCDFFPGGSDFTFEFDSGTESFILEFCFSDNVVVTCNIVEIKMTGGNPLFSI